MEGYVIDTDEGVVVLIGKKFETTGELDDLDEPSNCKVAIFEDKKEAQRVTRNIKRRVSSGVCYAEILPVIIVVEK